MRGVGSGDGLEIWHDDVVGWVAAEAPTAPARVLEVGCGEGWLTAIEAGEIQPISFRFVGQRP